MGFDQQLLGDQIQESHQTKTQEASNHDGWKVRNRGGNPRTQRQEQAKGAGYADEAQPRRDRFAQFRGDGQAEKEHFKRERDRQQQARARA